MHRPTALSPTFFPFSVLRLGAFLVAVLLLAVPLASESNAFVILINNGLAPPEPANVISSNLNLPSEGTIVVVTATGCTTDLVCLSPGTPTMVEVAVGGQADDVDVREGSSLVMTGGQLNVLIGRDTSIVEFRGGLASVVGVQGLLTVSGGNIMSIGGGGSVLIEGGRVDEFLGTIGHVTLQGGDVASSNLSVVDFLMTGGQMLIAVMDISGSASIEGGTFEVGDLNLRAGSSLSVSGGVWVAGTTFWDLKGDLELHGHSFVLDGVPVAPGTIITAVPGGGNITGTFSNGQTFGFQVIGSNFDGSISFLLAAPPAECADGIDNDLDGLIDAAQDPGCTDPADSSEQDPSLPCDDGLDNDGDGLIDLQDPACKDSSWSRENAQCQDGLDNDNNDGIDFDGGASIFGQMIQPPDPQCSSFWDNREAVNPPPSCGLGPELVLLTPLLMLAHGRRRRWRYEPTGVSAP